MSTVNLDVYIYICIYKYTYYIISIITCIYPYMCILYSQHSQDLKGSCPRTWTSSWGLRPASAKKRCLFPSALKITFNPKLLWYNLESMKGSCKKSSHVWGLWKIWKQSKLTLQHLKPVSLLWTLATLFDRTGGQWPMNRHGKPFIHFPVLSFQPPASLKNT